MFRPLPKIPIVVKTNNLGSLKMGNMPQNCYFLRFWAKLPPEMTSLTPGGQAENLKTLKKVCHYPYLVPEVH